MPNVYPLMKSIIKAKIKTKEYCLGRLNTFYAFGALTDEQYSELVDLTNEVYGNEA